MSTRTKRQVSRPGILAGKTVTEFNPDYTTTKRELRRIGILVAVFLAVFIVLAIFQNQLMALFTK